MVSCFEVFVAWDDEYDKVLALMRDVSKKKREEQMKLTWRIAPPHKKLESRLEQMRRFRRQHEQLRTVIGRVLRPTTVTVSTENNGGAGGDTLMLNTADATAIEVLL
jgi:dynein heavy chain 1